jgi:HEAT repeat protein
VDASLALLVSACFRKEQSPDVVTEFLKFLLDSFRKNFEEEGFPACHDLLTAMRIRVEKSEWLQVELTQYLPHLVADFRDEMRKASEGAETALDFLKLAGNSGIDFLLDWLADEEDQHARAKIIGYLERFSVSELLTRMEPRFSDPRWYVIRNLITIIGKLNLRENPPFLIRAASHPDYRIAKEIIRILMKSCSPKDGPLVSELLRHQDKSVQMQAMYLATTHRLMDTIPALLRLVDPSAPADTDVRAAAYQSLLRFQAKEAVPLAQALLERRSAGKAELAERNAAVRILGEIGRNESRELLERVAQSDPNAETRALAAGYL